MPETGPPDPNLFASFAATDVPFHKIDPDYLFFLQHVRPDGNSYALQVQGDGDSPPVILKYEKPPVASTGGEGTSASAPSKGGQKRNLRKEQPSSMEPPCYQTLASGDSDYLLFLRHSGMVDGNLVFKMEGHVITYPGEPALSEGSGEANNDGEDGVASGEDGVGEEQEEETSWEDFVSEEEEEEEEEYGGDDDEEEEEEYDDDDEVIINSDGSVGNDSDSDVCNCHVPSQKMEEVKDEEEEVIHDSGKDGAGKNKGVSMDMLYVLETDVTEQRIKDEEKEEELLNYLAVGTPEIVNLEMNSSNSHDTEPHIATGSHGVIWPAHIIERPESVFKQRLMHVLEKPFNQREYDELDGMATHRKMATKIRQLRSVEKFYYSGHEKSQSYYDLYPDLAKQVEGASYPNGLALLRGFFFWLKNIGHEDRFKPWRDDHKHYKVEPFAGKEYPEAHTSG